MQQPSSLYYGYGRLNGLNELNRLNRGKADDGPTGRGKRFNRSKLRSEPDGPKEKGKMMGAGKSTRMRFTGMTVAPFFGCYLHGGCLPLRVTAPNCVMLRCAASFSERVLLTPIIKVAVSFSRNCSA